MAQDWNELLEDPLFNMGAGLLAGAGTSNPWATALGHLNQYQQNRSLAEQRRLHSRLYEAQATRAEEEMRLRRDALARRQQLLAGITDPQERMLAEADMDEWVKSKFAKRDPKVVGAGGSLVDPNTGQPIFTAPPTPEKQPEFVRMAQALRDPNVDPETKRLIAQRLQTLSTHAPAASVRVENYPQPMPAINPQTGKVELTQFGSQGTPKPTGFAPAPDKSAKKMPAEIERMSIALDTAEKALDEWDKKLKKYDPRRDILDPKWRGEIGAAGADLQLQLKEANALGALTGPDVELMNRLIGSPLEGSAVYSGRDGLQQQSKEARAAIRRRKEALSSRYPAEAPEGAPPPSPTKKRVRVDANGNILQ